MASFKKFKIGNTSYDVKDANAGYSLSTSGSNLSLKNSAGTAISTVTVNGMDYDIIADEFDTTPTPGPSVGYDQNDVVYAVTQGQWGQQEVGWYVSLVNNNTSTPDHSTVGDWALLNNGMSPALSIPGWVNQYGFDYDPDDHNYYRVNLGAGAQINRWNELTKCPDKGTWTNQGGGSTYHQYSVGDYVIYNNDLYRCTGATTGQMWDSSKWTQVQIMDEIPSSIVSSVNVNPIYTSGTPIAQISVTDSNGTTGTTLVAPTVNAPLILESYNAITPTDFYNYLVAANDAGNAYSTPFISNKNKAAITSAWKDPTVEIWLKIGNNIAKLITRCTNSGSGDLTFVAQYGNAFVVGVQQNPYSAYACSNIYGTLNFSGNTLDSIDFYIDNSYYQSKYDHHI